MRASCCCWPTTSARCPCCARRSPRRVPRRRADEEHRMSDMNDAPLNYLHGFGNQHASEAVAGALPVGRNSPQRVAHGLYAELLSGTAFTAPRASNLRTWLYRRQPSVQAGGYTPLPHAWLKTGARGGVTAPPDPMRWQPVPIPDAAA